MKRITFLLLLLPSLVFGQIDKKKAFLLFNTTTEVQPAASGETRFAMTDIPSINIPDLYIAWNLPAGRNIPLLVFYSLM